MGFFDKAKAMQQQAKESMAAAGGIGGLAESVKGMATSPAGDMSEQLAYRERAQKLKEVGVEAPAVINSITPGEAQFGGSIQTVFEVTIKPSDGDAYPATIKQSMLQAQLDTMETGGAITVRYDPDDHGSALIYGW